MTQPALTNLHPNECSQEFYYPFAAILDRYAVSCNTFDDLSSRICALNEAKDLNSLILYMITGINELKLLTKHLTCKHECKLDGKCQCECKNTNNLSWVPKIYIWNPATCRFKNGKYVGSIADNLVTTCDETIEEKQQKVLQQKLL